MSEDENLTGLGSQESAPKGDFPALRFDAEAYRPHLADSDLTEAQQTELLAAIWQIMVAFADLGFGLDPVQYLQGLQALDNTPPSPKPAPKPRRDMVGCTGQFSEHTNHKPAKAHKRPSAERKES
ncbi:hypothetical protein [Pseudogemmobacter sonorensis]|uniref:hypothetical protein n=1 Tax=Pseudogemmobacter sonorensis TaxID=2989681 RepID=UPI0036B711E0